jgi:hypothetical protein
MGGGRREAFLVGKKEESLPSDSCLSEPFLGFLNFSVVFDTVTQTASRPLSFLVERYRFSVISIPYIRRRGASPAPDDVCVAVLLCVACVVGCFKRENGSTRELLVHRGNAGGRCNCCSCSPSPSADVAERRRAAAANRTSRLLVAALFAL